ncbi:MAG: purine-nucleoside phosphorylase [Mycoplasmataceae bacterium]|nr:purine-nucleoside phosphorylase [Mycoplasmataceae bacterium]
MTPHIKAKKNEIAKVVIAAGDPLRAKKMAEENLEDYKLVSDVRNMFIYTGKYNGKDVTVMGHGMGISSVAIYVHELFEFYDVDRVIRVGSGGSYQKDVKVMDIVVAEQAALDSNFGEAYGNKDMTLNASPKLVKMVKESSKGMDNVKFGKIMSSQWFYQPARPNAWKENAKDGVMLVEMEAGAMYTIAKHFNKDAITLITVSDSLVTGESLSPEERQNSFNQMLSLALDTFV